MQLPLNHGFQLSLVHSHGRRSRSAFACEFHPDPVAAVPDQNRIANRISIRHKKLEFVWHLTLLSMATCAPVSDRFRTVQSTTDVLSVVMILVAFRTLWRGVMRLTSSAMSGLQMQQFVANHHHSQTSCEAVGSIQWLTAAPCNPLDFLAHQLFNQAWQMRVQPAPQHALE